MADNCLQGDVNGGKIAPKRRSLGGPSPILRQTMTTIPGPLSADVGETFMIRDSEGGGVAQMRFLRRFSHEGRRDSDEVAALCRRMAACNELLEACEAAMRIESLWMIPDGVTLENESERVALHMMRDKFAAAIAKATTR